MILPTSQVLTTSMHRQLWVSQYILLLHEMWGIYFLLNLVLTKLRLQISGPT
jgi:hypothetical protein